MYTYFVPLEIISIYPWLVKIIHILRKTAQKAYKYPPNIHLNGQRRRYNAAKYGRFAAIHF